MRAWPLVLAGCASTQPAAFQLASDRMRDQQVRVWKDDLTLRCDPADAEVWLDGVPRGTCADFSGQPTALKLPDGMHRVEVKKSGFWPYQTWVEASGTRASLSVTLQPTN